MCKSFITFRTLIRLLSSMNLLVCDKSFAQKANLITLRTLMWLLSSMNPLVFI
ncbi:unnamed protein product [Staurois parvus]|uniref:Uncharacterized protein n=1 Tax=Staurois parvus TaxID=386267 RepID=A0ABN9CC35_9NEOB|nr:unnamed protein product [Staurois parvus]